MALKDGWEKKRGGVKMKMDIEIEVENEIML